MRKVFTLDRTFLNNYLSRNPNFGFNGLGEIVYRRSYSRLREDHTYETWHQTVERVVNGTFSLQLNRAENLKNIRGHAEIMYDKIFNFKFLPPGRGLWAMGTKITEEKFLYAALNNCAFVSTKDFEQETGYKPFTFLMDASMLGVGVGFDTKGSGKLEICKPNGSATYQIPDTREGWVNSLKLLLDSFFIPDKPETIFDYSLIRPAGRILSTFGGIAAGPGPLISMHENIKKILSRKINQKIDTRDIVDIMNMIGKCVVSGNVRRSAEIAFGEIEDEQFLELKNYDKYPERQEFGWASNNSVLGKLGMDYSKIADCIRRNGEPGLAWLENMQKYGRLCDPPNWKDYRALGGNPCLEQTLESYELCCLVEVFINNHHNLDEFLETLKYAFMYAKTVTLGLTHWEETNNVMGRNRRIGCSLTGLSQFLGRNGSDTLKKWCNEGYRFLKSYDKEISQTFGVPESIKVTSVKPSGTVSLLAGSTPGMHFPHAHHYIRRVRVPNTDKIMLNKLKDDGYHMEPDVIDPNATVVSIPIKENPKVKVLNEVSMWEQLSFAAFLQKNWADNQISCTVSFDPENEGHLIPEALDYFQHHLKGISFLPKTQSIPYPQMPYEEISEEKYHSMISHIDKHRKSAPQEIEQERPSYPDQFCDSCSVE
ncbi:unnamed protein product [Blepharisma stoltei]|uniref:ribonucleoside-triphosphate reductase (thioredoxin) n=1 Tax=Blepharisma stoltei TaxID=1481888 RepID=A0AAU9KHM8_9CILI|nr:unnamed protein product [Blepharisma stoltei]